jgi:signal transduction histidine kinase
MLYTAFLAVTIIALGAALYFASRYAFDDEIDDSLAESRSEIDNLSNDELQATLGLGAQAADDPILGTEELEDSDDNDRDEEDLEPASLEPGIFLVLTTEDGRVVANPLRVELEELDFAELTQDLGEGEHVEEISGDEGQFRFDTSLLPGERIGAAEDYYLHVGRSLAPRNEQLDRLLLIVLGGGALGIALSVVGGFVLSGRALVPIRDAYDRQTRFVSDASHELRTPLAVIQANNEVLLRNRHQSIDDNLEHVTAVEAESEHMSRLVGQLLTLARADEGELELSPRPFDLAELLGEVARDMGPLFESQELEVQLDLQPASVMADEGLVRQVAMVLLDNAARYTPAGGAVRLTSGRSGRWAQFAVSDSGPGIPSGEREHVFERFYRIDKARSREQGGTGLGLAIARSIVEAHGGSISLEPPDGPGSTFTVRLPARAA